MKYEIRKVFENGNLSKGCFMVEANSAEEAEQKYRELKNFKRKVHGLQITEAIEEPEVEEITSSNVIHDDGPEPEIEEEDWDSLLAANDV